MNWWRRLRMAWWAGVYVWQDPSRVERTVTLDHDTYVRVVCGDGGVLLKGHYAYHGVITERLTPWQVRCIQEIKPW